MNRASIGSSSFIFRLMKRVSGWAGNNVLWAQMIIVLCYVLLFGLNFYFGQFLRQEGIIIPKAVAYTSLTLTVVVYAIYQLMLRHGNIKKRFVFHKFFCMIVLFVSSIGMPAVFTQPAGTFPLQQGELYADMPSRSTAANDAPKTHEESQKPKMSLGAKIALITLTIVLCVFLEFFVAALSCTIACAGAPAIAVAVLILGTAAVVFLAIVMIRKILGKKWWKRHRKH